MVGEATRRSEARRAAWRPCLSQKDRRGVPVRGPLRDPYDYAPGILRAMRGIQTAQTHVSGGDIFEPWARMRSSAVSGTAHVRQRLIRERRLVAGLHRVVESARARA
jgi:hypothetical protein